MTTKTYAPYSIRHDITDKDLAGLLDYCERDLWFDIKATWAFEDIEYSYYIGKATLNYWYDGEIQFLYGELDLRMPHQLFFRTYRTLLPVIRDLYSK